MSETQKLTTEELQSIQELQAQYNKFVFDLGSIEAQLQGLLQQKSLLETEKSNVIGDIKSLGDRERELVTSLQEKYGTGSIDPQTGEITPM
jgi:conjugal transfer/entry exclusion protein